MNIFIGGAWPYANGSLHIGHIVALLPGDVIARYYRKKGDNVLYVSGSDCHGTPISIRAKSEGVTPKEVANKYHSEFKYCFDTLNFSYDYYGRTDDKFHKVEVQNIITSLYDKGLIYEKDVDQIYCNSCQQFLPDRYVEGVCPKCKSNARGDQCDYCGYLLDPLELLDRKCKLCGEYPTIKESKHLYFSLSKFQDVIKNNLDVNKHNWKINAINNTERYIIEGLHDRAISRDISLGIDIPIDGFRDKKVYVWIDAILGYLTMSKKWAIDENKSYEEFWNEDAVSYYVHGKDNIPFHSIILPALLNGIGYEKLVDRIVSSEYLTLEGKKISTSNNWAVWIPDIVKRYNSDSLRYFFLINAPEKRDSDFSWREFVNSNNGELLGAYGNLVNRTLVFIKKYYDNKVINGEIDKNIKSSIKKLYGEVGVLIEQGNLRIALESIFEVIRKVNKYFDLSTPWITVKENNEKCINSIYTCIYAIANLSNLLEPFLPESSFKIKEWLSINHSKWSEIESIDCVLSSEISILFERIDKKKIELEEEELKSCQIKY